MIGVFTLDDGNNVVEVPGRNFQFPGGEQHYDGFEDLDAPVAILVNGANAEDYLAASMVSQVYEDVTLVCPYLPAARSDRGVVTGALSYANLILDVVRPDTVITLDPHSQTMPNLLAGTVVTYPASRAVAKAVGFRSNYGWVSEYSGIIAPDAGAVGRAKAVANKFEIPLYQAEKHRDFDTGKLSGFSCDALPDEGKFLVVDDICDGGGTFMGLAEATGVGRDRLDLWVSHGVFSGRAPQLMDHYGKIITTNSHPGHSREDVGAEVLDINSILIREALSR